MAHQQYFEQIRNGGRVTFKKYSHINAVKHKILRSSKGLSSEIRRNTRDGVSHQATDRRAASSSSRQKITPHRARQKSGVFESHAREVKRFATPLGRAIA